MTKEEFREHVTAEINRRVNEEVDPSRGGKSSMVERQRVVNRSLVDLVFSVMNTAEVHHNQLKATVEAHHTTASEVFKATGACFHALESTIISDGEELAKAVVSDMEALQANASAATAAIGKRLDAIEIRLARAGIFVDETPVPNALRLLTDSHNGRTLPDVRR